MNYSIFVIPIFIWLFSASPDFVIAYTEFYFLQVILFTYMNFSPSKGVF